VDKAGTISKLVYWVGRDSQVNWCRINFRFPLTRDWLKPLEESEHLNVVKDIGIRVQEERASNDVRGRKSIEAYVEMVGKRR